MRFEIFTPQELAEKYGDGEPDYLCPLLGVLKQRFRRKKDIDSIGTIEMIQEMGHELRLWGRSQKSRAEKAEAERDQLKADLAGRENILDVMSEEILSRPPEGKLDWLREQARKWMVIPREAKS